MKIGYACLTEGVPHVRYKSCLLKNATPDHLMNLIDHNLKTLAKVLDYNIENNIRLFRITSDLIPFGSHPINTLAWQQLFSDSLAMIGQKAKDHGMRLTMHPGQYTVLNSPNEEVVKRAMLDLNYHCAVLDGLGLSPQHKMILHIGGIYGNKEAAMNRFIANFDRLDETVKQRLIIENDDKSYTVEDVLAISKQINIPVVFDNLHHAILHGDHLDGEIDLINRVKQTWKPEDGTQKIHYSEQAWNKKIGSHSETVAIDQFMAFYQRLNRHDIDIMLEVKDKNLSALKCIQATTKDLPKQALEKEWHRYQALVLEHSPEIFQQIQACLQEKKADAALPFYRFIEIALQQEVQAQNALKAAQMIWSAFQKQVSEKEQLQFEKEILKIEKGLSTVSMKRFLFRLAQHYELSEWQNAYYFKDIL